MTSRHSQWKALPALLRCKLSLAVASTALTGFVYASHALNWRALSVFIGVFLLTGAASAFNQVQEKSVDYLMERTRNRPLPSNTFTSRQAVFVAIVAGGAGLALIFLKTTALATGLAAFNMFWYNCVYTPLKRTTGFAVLVGALAGALGPLIGYCAAGGHITDGFIVVCVFMYLWQVSHFLLLLFKFRDEYQRAGIPTIAFTMNEDRFKVTFFIWILGTAGSTLLMPFFHIIASMVLLPMLIIGNSLFVFYFYIAVFRSKKEFTHAPAFRCMYLFQGFVLALLAVEALSNIPHHP
ncbi:MAG: protoheme IX farnesyltransferase [Chitinivibrionales bacterium]